MTEAPHRSIAAATFAHLRADPAACEAAGLRLVAPLAQGGQYRRRTAEFVGAAPASPSYLAAFAPAVQEYGPASVGVFEDALVVGQGALVARDGTLIYDSVRSIVEQHLLPDGFQARDSALVLAPRHDVRRVERPALLAKAPWWRNYGHWLLDSAALLALAADYIRGRDLLIVVGRQTERAMREAVFRTIEAVAPGAPVLEHDDGEAVLFSELHYVSPVSVSPCFKLPDALSALRAKLLPRDLSGRRRRLYLQRASGRSRPLVNEPEILELCRSQGFEIVCPETHSLADQVRMFAEAELVMGVKGAALTNLAFAPADCTAIVLAPGHWIEPIFWDLTAQRGMRYIEVIGTSEAAGEHPNEPFTVPPGGVAHAVAAASKSEPIRPSGDGRCELSLPDHKGDDYRRCLQLIHETLQPRSYVEIGCLGGETLALAACPTIGIDPAFEPKIAIPPRAGSILLFQMESDAFFARHNPLALFERHIDLAFIDGMHRIENVLRDFINVERFCHAGSVIVLHDCVPLDHHMACRDMDDAPTRARSSHPEFWAGDVWKILPILARFRPDLSVRIFDAPPTGLVVVRGLDPANRTLEQQFERIIDMFREPEGEAELFRAVLGSLRPESTANLATAVRVG